MIDNEIVFLPMSKIKVNPWNPNEMSDPAFKRLIKEIETSGFISALQVVPLDEGVYRIIGGEHRYKAAQYLGYKEVPVVIMSDVQFKDEDLQKFLTVRLNMLHGELDGDKFRTLYEEMADKYGADQLQDLFGVTDDDQWASVMKDIRKQLKDAGIPKADVDKAMEAMQGDKSMDNLSKILNGIFSKNADTLAKHGFMLFDVDGVKMFYVDVSKKLFNFFDEIQINNVTDQIEPRLTSVLNEVLQSVKV
jgi:hypothetical protein